MPRYIDADALYRDTEKKIAEAHEARMAVVDDEFLDLINDAHIEDDVVEVVRCKGCMFWRGKDHDGVCIENGLATRMETNFAAEGKRKAVNLMYWTEIVSTILKKDADKVMLAPLSNIAGADIKFDKGYGTIKINVPADVADNLTNGSGKYVGGLLLIDRKAYDEAKGGESDDRN